MSKPDRATALREVRCGWASGDANPPKLARETARACHSKMPDSSRKKPGVAVSVNRYAHVKKPLGFDGRSFVSLRLPTLMEPTA
jgi:hypothetical protein